MKFDIKRALYILLAVSLFGGTATAIATASQAPPAHQAARAERPGDGDRSRDKSGKEAGKQDKGDKGSDKGDKGDHGKPPVA